MPRRSRDEFRDYVNVSQEHGLGSGVTNCIDDSRESSLSYPLSDSMVTTKMSANDARSLVMLFGLHFVHAIPLAFSWTTMPVLLRQQASYLAVGSFVLTQYPYTLKALWSPLLGNIHVPWLGGSKKGWLIPSFLGNAISMYWLALYQDQAIREIAAGSTTAMMLFSAPWLGINFCCANIRIALDAWSLELVSPRSLYWYGSVVTIAESLATFIAFNLFLGLASPRTTRDHVKPHEAGGEHDYASVRVFFTFATLVSVVTACLLFLKREVAQIPRRSKVADTYGILVRILSLRPVWTLSAVHMISLIGFVTNDTVTTLQLVKNGFADRDLALIATISFPAIACTSIITSRLFRTRHPFEVWRLIFPFRLAAAVIAQACIAIIYTFRDHPWRWYIAILPSTITPMLEAMMYVCVMTFHAEVSDPSHGAVYLSLLAIPLELRWTVLQFLSTEAIGIIDIGEDSLKATKLLDGYQYVNAAGVLAALPLFWFFLRPATIWLQEQHKSVWRVGVHDHHLSHVPLSDIHE